ncbi:MAG: ABC transporter permease subunit [Roseiflexaceae bacterium]|nr:ABC transporter permease subunit [Roseiflexaceae bacterium]
MPRRRGDMFPVRWLRPLLVVLIVGWVLLPLLPLPVWSVSAGWRWPDLLPQQLSGRAWAYVLSPTAQALPALLTSIVLALVVTALALAAGIPAALALGRRQFRGRSLVELIVFAPILVPPLTVAMGLQVLLIRVNLADTFGGVVLVHLIFALPYVVLILASACAALGPEWEQQARSLGAGVWRAFWHVTLPLLRPALTVAALLAFLVSWGQYALTLLIGGGQVWTLPLLVFSAARSSDPALTAAAALLFIAPTVVFLGVAARNLDQRDGGLGLL